MWATSSTSARPWLGRGRDPAVTRFRDVNGTVWFVPNGEIIRVGNQSKNWSRAVIDVDVGYGEDLARVHGPQGHRPRHVGGR